MQKNDAQKELDRAINEIGSASSLLDFHHDRLSSQENFKTKESVGKAIERLERGLNRYKKGLELERDSILQ